MPLSDLANLTPQQAATIRGIARLRQAGYPDSQIFAMDSGQVQAYGQGDGSAGIMRLGNLTASDRATIAQNKADLAQKMYDDAITRAQNPYNVVAADAADAPYHLGDPMMTKYMANTGAVPGDAEMKFYEQWLQDYLSNPNADPTQLAQGRMAGIDPATVDRINNAYNTDPADATKFFGGPMPGNAAGGRRILHRPVTAFDISGNPVFTAAENGREAIGGGRGLHFYPQPGVSRQLAPGETNAIAQTTAANVGARAIPQPIGGMQPNRNFTPTRAIGTTGAAPSYTLMQRYNAHAGQPNYDPAYDLDHDGVITIKDISAISQGARAAYGSQRGQANYNPLYDPGNTGRDDILGLNRLFNQSSPGTPPATPPQPIGGMPRAGGPVQSVGTTTGVTTTPNTNPATPQPIGGMPPAGRAFTPMSGVVGTMSNPPAQPNPNPAPPAPIGGVPGHAAGTVQRKKTAPLAFDPATGFPLADGGMGMGMPGYAGGGQYYGFDTPQEAQQFAQQSQGATAQQQAQMMNSAEQQRTANQPFNVNQQQNYNISAVGADGQVHQYNVGAASGNYRDAYNTGQSAQSLVDYANAHGGNMFAGMNMGAYGQNAATSSSAPPAASSTTTPPIGAGGPSTPGQYTSAQQAAAKQIGGVLAGNTMIPPDMVADLNAGNIPGLARMSGTTWNRLKQTNPAMAQQLVGLWRSTGQVAGASDAEAMANVDASFSGSVPTQPVSRYQIGDTSSY